MATKNTKKPAKGRPDHTYIAYEGIKKMLFENEILPGQKISYRQLAERLQMSPTPVIQALKSYFISVKAQALKSLGQMIVQGHTGPAN